MVVHVGLFERRSKDLFTIPEPARAAPDISGFRG
jgi:hypothetical protein